MAECLSLFYSQHGTVKCIIRTGARKIIKSLFRHANDMVPDKGCTFPCPIFRMFNAALPFENSPTRVVIGRKLAEYGFKIHLSVPQRTEASGPVNPGLVAAIYSRFASWIEFCIFH